ncbi:ATP-binding cassette domain-containing protein [Actinokineospora pegani]|uniref:ATP-binding cassette domain-containing protein n=1 Tax=Actinokineospora pegani TaxID=2654637 RepID=UPI0018D36AEC|nr:ATP-binding cassette domain-containing protein [Actinokineospora pegani]
MNGPVVAVRGLVKSLGGRRVLDGVDLEVPAGGVLALLGPNGAGKTTVVRVLSTLLRPDAGTVVVNGHDVVAAPHRVRGTIGLTGQYAAVDGLLTGAENLRMMARLARLGRRAAHARADALLERFDLVEAGGRQVRAYSGGMRRRLDLAASLVARPPLLVLDEPTTGLDPRSRATLWSAIRELLTEGTTVVLTTQYLEEADRLADHVTVLDGGRVVAEGSPARLKASVGADRLELGFADAAAASSAADLLGGAATGASVSLALSSVPHLRDVLAAVDPVTVAIAKPTLDDVFLELTGGRR